MVTGLCGRYLILNAEPDVQVQACLAAAVVHAGIVPSKLNLVIQPLIGAIRTGWSPAFRSVACVALAALASTCKPVAAERCAFSTLMEMS